MHLIIYFKYFFVFFFISCFFWKFL